MKPVLGRNLGTLLGGPVATPVGESSSAPMQQPGPGVRSLLRGQYPEESAKETIPTAPAPRATLPRWYYFAADLLLVGLALALFFKGPAPIGWKKIFFCTMLVAFGGCLSLASVLMRDEKNPE